MFTIQGVISAIGALLPNIKALIEILVAIVGGYCALKGISYLQTLKARRTAAIFTFWAQLSIRITELKYTLQNRHSIVNGLFSKTVRSCWNSNDAEPTDTMVNKFYDDARETLVFLKKCPDQMPAYPTWLEDYNEFIIFLIDVTFYNIKDLNNNFKFDDAFSLKDRNNYCVNICNIMNRMLDGIHAEQSNAVIEMINPIASSKQAKKNRGKNSRNVSAQ